MSTAVASQTIDVRLHRERALARELPRLEAYMTRGGHVPLSRHLGWLTVLADGLDHVPHLLEATEGDQTRGVLPLAYVRSALFGRFLVSLPYLNCGGVLAEDERAAEALIDCAVGLADEFGVRYLELRHERAVEHPALAAGRTEKVHMRRDLPDGCEKLWKQLSPKVRNQVRKGQKNGLSVAWGGRELLTEFYEVFSHNMRDLGTPVYAQRLFDSVLVTFPARSELCVVRAEKRPLAAALLLHGRGVCEVTSASSLRQYNHTCANMLLYWHLLERSVERGQAIFDFGRSSKDGNTYRFKKQWGAEPYPAEWQYYVRTGSTMDMRPENSKYQRFIRLWQRLPLRVTRWVGPLIVRGIP